MMSSTMISGTPAKHAARDRPSTLLMHEPYEPGRPRISTYVPQEPAEEGKGEAEEDDADSEYEMIFDDKSEEEWSKVNFTNDLKAEDQKKNYIICQNSQALRTPKQIIKDKVQLQVSETAKAAAKASAPYVKAGIDCVTEGALKLAATETAGNWLRKLKGVVDRAVNTVTVLQNHHKVGGTGESASSGGDAEPVGEHVRQDFQGVRRKWRIV